MDGTLRLRPTETARAADMPETCLRGPYSSLRCRSCPLYASAVHEVCVQREQQPGLYVRLWKLLELSIALAYSEKRKMRIFRCPYAYKAAVLVLELVMQ